MESKFNIYIKRRISYYKLFIIFFIFSSFSKIICLNFKYQIRIKFGRAATGQVYVVNSGFSKIPDRIYVNDDQRAVDNKIVIINERDIGSDIYIVFLNGVQNLAGMFSGLNTITEVDFSHYDGSEVTYMDKMFEYCKGLKFVNFTGFKTNSVVSFLKMFDSCFALKSLDLSSFDTSKTSSFEGMFQNCISLTSLDLSNFVFKSSGVNLKDMFKNCTKLKYINIKNIPNSGYSMSIIEKTPNNLVICFNKTIASSLYEILKN